MAYKAIAKTNPLDEANEADHKMYLNYILDAIPLAGLVVIVVLFAMLTKGRLFTPYNMQSIANQMFLYILGGLGCLFLFAQGGIDLSMAANVGLCAIIGARVMQVNVGLGIIVTIAVGVLVGVVMGLIYAYANIDIFIQGLAMNFLLNGTLFPLSAGYASIPAPRSIIALKSNVGEGVIAIVAIILVTTIYNHTKFGKECRAIGAGSVSSVQSGVNVAGSKIMAFVITGLTCGLVAFFTLIRTGSASMTTGTNFNFNVMLCLVLGGCSMSGGPGVKVRNAIVGAALLIILSNGLVLSGVNARAQDIIKGILFILMIVATAKFSANRGRI